MNDTPDRIPETTPQPADKLVQWLDDARRRTIELTADLDGSRRFGPKMAIVNPPIWELGHVGFFHDYFALRKLHGLDHYQHPNADRLYDSSTIEHDSRWELPFPDMDATFGYLRTVRDAMVERLPAGEADPATSYVYQLTTLHEDMHAEAFTYTRQTLGYPAPELGGVPALPEPEAGPLPGDVDIPGGEHLLGSDATVPFRFDNEKPAHTVEVAPFAIARAPVTNMEYLAFVDDGGYARRELWSDEGWAWLQQAGLEAPAYWTRGDDGAWQRRRFDRTEALRPHQPVCHVSFFEAEAYCLWAGRRLPTEAEWEVAASRAPDGSARALAEGKRRWPWGDTPPDPARANLDGWRMDCVDVAALAQGDSAFGCRQMIGNVWEWTSSVFGPFPGFRADLYRDYSEPWFPEGRRVLRGGAWPTRSRLIHNGYRNFFTPERCDVPTGFRTCAFDSQ
ncbi:MAG: selenoneine synthase SenA [Xanthomonadales bacterium]|nr:selenoneine synthase SenA [Xanthomonadales bacterium]